MKHEPISPDPSRRRVDAEMIARDRAELAAGVGVDHAVVSLWLETWGKPGRQPFKEWLAGWNG